MLSLSVSIRVSGRLIRLGKTGQDGCRDKEGPGRGLAEQAVALPRRGAFIYLSLAIWLVFHLSAAQRERERESRERKCGLPRESSIAEEVARRMVRLFFFFFAMAVELE